MIVRYRAFIFLRDTARIAGGHPDDDIVVYLYILIFTKGLSIGLIAAQSQAKIPSTCSSITTVLGTLYTKS